MSPLSILLSTSRTVRITSGQERQEVPGVHPELPSGLQGPQNEHLSAELRQDLRTFLHVFEFAGL